jgi:hypothetical protein
MELSTITNHLKQLSFPELKPVDREFMDACFPEFARLERHPLKEAGFALESTSMNALPLEFGRLRRFSGRPSLGPGHYWSVCHDQSGIDAGTMISELMSYWQASTGYLPELRDREFRIERNDGSSGLLRVLEVEADRFGIKGLVRRRLGRVGHERVAFKLSVVPQTIERVVDLRMPATQRWFFETFVDLEMRRQRHPSQRHRNLSAGVKIVTLKTRGVRDFVELLPTLVMPDMGGGIFHQAVGTWLRSRGVNGLLYPSARRDAMMTSESSEVVFDGWNFVDYRGAAPSGGWEELFGLQPQWLLPERIGVTIRRRAEFPGWAIVGAERREQQRLASQARQLTIVRD